MSCTVHRLLSVAFKGESIEWRMNCQLLGDQRENDASLRQNERFSQHPLQFVLLYNVLHICCTALSL